MPKYEVTVNITYQKTLTVYGSDEAEAEEKAVDIAKGWNNVYDAEAAETREAD